MQAEASMQDREGEQSPIQLGEFDFESPWCACGKPFSVKCENTSGWGYTNVTQKQSIILHQWYSSINEFIGNKTKYENIKVQNIIISSTQIKYILENMPIDDEKTCTIEIIYECPDTTYLQDPDVNDFLFPVACKHKKYIFPKSPTVEMISIISEFERKEIDDKTLLSKLNSTISFTEEIEYDFFVKNSRYEMEFRLLSNTKRFQICSGDMNGNGYNIMYNKLTKCKDKHQSNYWNNVYGEVKSMRVDDITII